MGQIKAVGQLAHHFHGIYWCAIVLVFDDAASARDALGVLGEPWKVGQRNDRVLAASFDSATLDVEKQRLGRYGADERKIDSLAKSIDYGEPFEVAIDVAPAEQCALFAGAQ